MTTNHTRELQATRAMRDAANATNTRLLAQRDELVAALERILSLSTIVDLRDDPDLHSATKQARAALAKVQA